MNDIRVEICCDELSTPSSWTIMKKKINDCVKCLNESHVIARNKKWWKWKILFDIKQNDSQLLKKNKQSDKVISSCQMIISLGNKIKPFSKMNFKQTKTSFFNESHGRKTSIDMNKRPLDVIFVLNHITVLQAHSNKVANNKHLKQFNVHFQYKVFIRRKCFSKLLKIHEKCLLSFWKSCAKR